MEMCRAMTEPQEILYRARLDILDKWLDEWPDEFGPEITGRMGYACDRLRRMLDRALVRAV